MRVVMISGSYPPEACGVGDYTARLVAALHEAGCRSIVLRWQSWTLAELPHILRALDDLAPDVIHLQYPTIGYGRSLLPQLIALRRPAIVTIHEATQAHLARRLSLLPFTCTAKALLFTSAHERSYIARFCPWIRSRSTVIPIASAIPFAVTPNAERSSDEIVHFGLIRPGKGIELVVALASILREDGLSVRIVGMPDPRHRAYFEELQRRTAALPVTWDIGLDASAVAQRIARASYAYLPYPDGASERRSTLPAVLGNGPATITTRGDQTPDGLVSAVAFAADPAAAAAIIRSWRAAPSLAATTAAAGLAYARRFTWNDIARRHLAIYRGVGGAG